MKQNALILQYAEREIQRRIAREELILPEVADENLQENLDIWCKMMTIAVNKALGVGKKRFREKVQPVLNQLEDEYFQNKDTADQEYAMSVIERLYNEIMED